MRQPDEMPDGRSNWAHSVARGVQDRAASAVERRPIRCIPPGAGSFGSGCRRRATRMRGRRPSRWLGFVWRSALRPLVQAVAALGSVGHGAVGYQPVLVAALGEVSPSAGAAGLLPRRKGQSGASGLIERYRSIAALEIWRARAPRQRMACS